MLHLIASAVLGAGGLFHVWHAFKGRIAANDSGVLTNVDKVQATGARFVTLAIVVISLVLLARFGS